MQRDQISSTSTYLPVLNIGVGLVSVIASHQYLPFCNWLTGMKYGQLFLLFRNWISLWLHPSNIYACYTYHCCSSKIVLWTQSASSVSDDEFYCTKVWFRPDKYGSEMYYNDAQYWQVSYVFSGKGQKDLKNYEWHASSSTTPTWYIGAFWELSEYVAQRSHQVSLLEGKCARKGFF